VGETNLLNYQQGLFERICSLEELQLAFKAVKRNHGAAGVDGISIELPHQLPLKKWVKLT